MHIRIRASATSMAVMAMAVLVYEGKNGIAGILTFTHVATSNVSSLVFFEALVKQSRDKRTNFFCVFTSVGFESHQYSGTRDEINTPRMETDLMRGINGSQ